MSDDQIFNAIKHNWTLEVWLWSIFDYIIAQVILTFWLVPTYDLLEDSLTIDVIITEFIFL